MPDDSRPAGATRPDDETLDYLKLAVAREFDLSEANGRRLRGATVSALKDDARAMRAELALPPLDDEQDDRARDAQGRFSRSGSAGDMNRLIRQASGR